MAVNRRRPRRREPILPANAFDRWRRGVVRWLRRSEGSEPRADSFLRRAWMGRRLRIGRLLLIAGTGWMLYVLVAGENGILAIHALRHEKSRLDERVEELSTELASLRQHLRENSGDPYYLEKVAREEYGLARPGEVIYHFDSRELVPPPSPGSPSGRAPSTGVDTREERR